MPKQPINKTILQQENLQKKGSTPKKIPYMPNWHEWKENRPICKLWEGLLIAHNITSNRDVFEKLWDRRDPRAKCVKTHRNTAYKALRNQDPLLKYLEPLPKKMDEVEIFLPDFVSWVIGQHWDVTPDEFKELEKCHSKPPESADWKIWSDRPNISIREAVSLRLNVEPRIHSRTMARLIYKELFHKYDNDEETVLRALRATPEKYGVVADPNCESIISANNFVEIIKRLEWNAPSELIKLSEKASSLKPILNSEQSLSNIKHNKTGNIIQESESDNRNDKSEVLLGALILVFARSIIDKSDFKKSGKLNSKYISSSGELKILPIATDMDEMLSSLKDSTYKKNGIESIRKKLTAVLKHFDEQFIKKYIFQDDEHEIGKDEK